MSKSVVVKSVGCRLNQFESDFIKSELIAKGFKNTEKNADICVVNTCTVTRQADRKSKKLIKKLKKENPGAFMIATGCMVETNKNDLEELQIIDRFVDNHEKLGISNLFRNNKNHNNQKKITYTVERTRPYVKIQDGCNHDCSYCIVKTARGKSRSESFNDIIKISEFLAGQSYKEIVITGVNIGDYQDNNRKLKDLLKELINIKNLRWIRLSSIEPTDIDDELIEVLKNEKICAYFHIPLQSGSDKILKLMKRPYNSRYYKEMIESLRKKKKDLVIGTDIITGFPGETENDFQDTCDFLKQNNIFYLHIFRYSPRENTEAYSLPDPVPEEEKYRRYQILKRFKTDSKVDHYENLLDRSLDVIVENKIIRKKYVTATSSNYIPVLLPLSKYKLRIGEIVTINVISVEKESVYGE